MIYIILDAFYEKNKEYFHNRKFIVFGVIVIILMMIFMVLSYWYSIFIFFLLIPCSLFFVLSVLCYKRDKRKIKERFENSNKILENLKTILCDFKITNNSNNTQSVTNNSSWYSSERIIYLIEMCDNLIKESKGDWSKGINFLKTSIASVIGFGAGVFADKASLDVNISIAVIVLFIVVMIYGLIEAGDLLSYFFFERTSPMTISNFKAYLMDLLLRDFPESVKLELKIETTL